MSTADSLFHAARQALNHPIHHRFTATGEQLAPAIDDLDAISYYRHAKDGCVGCAALLELDRVEYALKRISNFPFDVVFDAEADLAAVKLIAEEALRV